jgi:hypothetical protein
MKPGPVRAAGGLAVLALCVASALPPSPPALGSTTLVYKTARLNVYRLRATMGVLDMIAD